MAKDCYQTELLIIFIFNYKCCHGHTHQNMDAAHESGVVQIEKSFLCLLNVI